MVILKDKTKSLCHICFTEIDARVIEKNNEAYLIKECPEHGEFDILIEKNASFYKKLMNKQYLEQQVPFGDLAFAVTHLCDLNCNICYLPERKDNDFPLQDIKKAVSEFAGRFVWLTGGEPTLRKDLPQIIEYVVSCGKEAVLLTNGIKLADFSYVNTLKNAGLKWVHFSFNGFNDDDYEKINGSRLLKVKLKALSNLKKAGIETIISMMLVKGLNEKELRKVLQFCLKNNSFISELRIRGVTHIGRYAENECMFLSEIVKDVSKIIGINDDDMVNNYLKGRWRCNSEIRTPYHLHVDLFSLLMSQMGIKRSGNPLHIKIRCIFKLLPKVGLTNLIKMILRKLRKKEQLLKFGICLRAWPDKYRIDLGELHRSSSAHAMRIGNKVLPFCYALILNERNNML